MKHLRKHNEGIFGSREGELYEKPPSEMFNNKTKVLYVGEGNGDYSMLTFEDKYNDTPVIDIINDLDSYKSTEEDEGDWTLKVYEFGKIDPEFVKFVRDRIQDYDDSKHHGFYLENEIVKR